MSERRIIHISYFPLCFLSFCSVLFFCELIGIVVAIWDRDWTAIVGGAFFGSVFGAFAGLLTLLFLLLFNLIAPITNGVSVQLFIPDTPPLKKTNEKNAIEQDLY